MENIIDKKARIDNLFGFLCEREMHMSISNMQRDFLFALRRFDVEKEKIEMNEKSKVDAKYAILVTYETIVDLLEKVRNDEMNGEMNFQLIVDQKKSLFELTEVPAV